jgi:RimJ/RimL family protein N-acetyltransferase
MGTALAWLDDSIAAGSYLLRKPRLSDAVDIFQNYAQDDDVVRYLVWRKHENLHTTHAYLEHCLAEWDSGARHYAIVQKASGAVIGMLALRRQQHAVNLGYVLAQAHWYKGCLTQVCRTVLPLLLDHAEIYRVDAMCDVDNPASARVLEKAGMRREGVLHAYALHPNRSSLPRDVLCYAMTKAQWEAGAL